MTALKGNPHVGTSPFPIRSFGNLARAWSATLSQPQRGAWDIAGPQVQSAKRLGQGGPLTGQQLFQGLNSARARIGKPMLLLPPERVIFPPNPVGQLTLTNGDDGVRILLHVTGPVTEDIMVFGQAPCSAGRMKRRNVAYLGLSPAPENGIIDITDLYVARYGQPRPGQKIFIVTRQQQDGWEGLDKETSEIVPHPPAQQPASSAEPHPSHQSHSSQPPAEQQASVAGSLTLSPYMHKGCTRDAEGVGALDGPVSGASLLGEPGPQQAENTLENPENGAQAKSEQPF